MERILVTLIVLLVVLSIVEALWLIRYKNILRTYERQLDKLYNGIILQSDLIESSINTIEEAYKISDGDLKSWISEQQTKKEGKRKK